MNHGIVTTGEDVADAVVRAVILERACSVQLKVRAHGGTPSWSSDEEALAKRENVYPQPARLQVWEHLARRYGSEKPSPKAPDAAARSSSSSR